MRTFYARLGLVFLLVAFAAYGSFVMHPRVLPTIIMFVCALMMLVCLMCESALMCVREPETKPETKRTPIVRTGQGSFRVDVYG